MSICVQYDVTRHLICLFWLVPSDITQPQLLSYALHFKFTIPDWRTLLHDFGIVWLDAFVNNTIVLLPISQSLLR